MNIQSQVNYYLSLSYNELEQECGRNYQKVSNYILNRYTNINPNHLLIGFIFTSIAADGKFSEKEWKFLKSFIGGYSYDDAHKIASDFYSNQARIKTKQVIECFTKDIKEAALKIILAVLCVDGRYNEEESSFLSYILN